MTFWGFAIPETARPSPKSAPENRATAILSNPTLLKARYR